MDDRQIAAFRAREPQAKRVSYHPITGHTELIVHLGVPTEAFRAPGIYNPYFEHRGIDAVVVPMGCEATEFSELLPLLFRLRNLRGALITMPHKVAAAALLDESSPAVAVAGACNAIRRDDRGRLVGDLFDGEGFVRGVERRSRRIDGATALVVGCGGVGSAIAVALADRGARALGVFDIGFPTTTPAALRRLAEIDD